MPAGPAALGRSVNLLRQPPHLRWDAPRKRPHPCPCMRAVALGLPLPLLLGRPVLLPTAMFGRRALPRSRLVGRFLASGGR